MIKALKSIACLVSLVLGFSVASVAAEKPNSVVSDTLSIWVMDNGLGSKIAMNRLVKKFYRETQIPVKVTALSWSEAFSRITNTFADSNEIAPDVIQLGSTWVPHFAAEGVIRPIDFLMAKIDSARFLGEGLRSSHIAGRPEIYSVPWFIDVRGFFANERLWQKLGFDDADVETYPQFIGVLKTIAKADLKNDDDVKVTPFALPGKDDWAGQQCMAPLVWSHGGDFVVPSGKGYRSSLLDSNTLVGLALYAEIMGDVQMAPYSLSENSAENAKGFVRSERVLLYGTSEIIKQLDHPESAGGLADFAIAKDGIKVMNLVSGPSGKFSFMGGSHLALGQKKDRSKNALAEQFLVYMLRADNIDAYSRQVGFLPADRSILHIWNRDSRYSKLVAGLEYCRSFPNIPKWGEVENILIELSNGMGMALSKTKDLQQRSEQLAKLVYNANKKINDVLGHSENLDETELLPWVQQFFMHKYKVIYPRNSTEFVSRDELASVDEFMDKMYSSKLMIVAGVGVLVVGILIVLSFARRRKK